MIRSNGTTITISLLLIFAVIAVAWLYNYTRPRMGIIVLTEPIASTALPLPIDPSDEYRTQPLLILPKLDSNWITVKTADGTVISINPSYVRRVITDLVSEPAQ